jgi:hypothetical protein
MSNNTVVLSGTFIGTSEVVCGSVGETLKFTIYDAEHDGEICVFASLSQLYTVSRLCVQDCAVAMAEVTTAWR